MKKVVMLGGGTGLSNMLNSLKNLDIDLVVGVVVSDNGGSTGKIRQYYDIPAPGDLRKNINTFIEDDDLKNLVEYRFDKYIQKHSLGNLILAALVNIKGNMSEAVLEYSRIFGISAKIFPITDQSKNILGYMEDGEIVKGETQIAKYNSPIKKISYEGEVVPNSKLIEAINEADYIILSAGSLFTSTIPNLIIPEVVQALKKSKGKKIYICNIMTQYGETQNFSVKDHVDVIEKHTYKNMIDIIIMNNYYEIAKDLEEKYQKEKASLVKYNDDLEDNYEVICEKLIKEETFIRHDTEKIKEILLSIWS